MKQFAVIGNPIKHSLSPILHNWVFKFLSIKANYRKIHVSEDEIPNIIKEIRDGSISGINVTIPYKESIVKYIDEINPRSIAIGSINCIMKSQSKLIGNNTDWFGFCKTIEKNQIKIREKNVFLFGAGGTAKAIIFALKQLGVNKIYLFNRTVSKANKLKDNIVSPHHYNELDNLINQDSILVNTTSVGMQSNDSPIELGLINKQNILIDVIYNPLETCFIKYGNSIGAKTINGLEMFIFQALASLDLWFGESITKQVNFQQIKTYLEENIC